MADDDMNARASELNLNVLPGPFAPSDVSITNGMDILNLDTYDDDDIHKTSIVLREKVVIVGENCVGKSSLVQSFLASMNTRILNTHQNHRQGQRQMQVQESVHTFATPVPNEFDGKYHMTTGMDFHIAQVPVTDTNIIVDLFLYDMGGQSIFNQREMPKAFWKDCTYIMCVYDVSSRKSLQCIKTWLASVKSRSSETSKNSKGGSQRSDECDKKYTIPAILVANKIDLREGGSMSGEVGREGGIADKDDNFDSSSMGIAEVMSEEGMAFAKQNGMEYFECTCTCSIETSRSHDNTIHAPFQYIANHAVGMYQKDI